MDKAILIIFELLMGLAVIAGMAPFLGAPFLFNILIPVFCFGLLLLITFIIIDVIRL